MKFNDLYYKPYKDMFNYYNLVQKINHGYRLYFNNKDNFFAVVNVNQNYEICKVFNSLFRNFEHDLRFSNITNFSLIMQKIDLDNEKLIQKNKAKHRAESKLIAKELLSISNRSTNIKTSDINKIIGATKC